MARRFCRISQTFCRMTSAAPRQLLSRKRVFATGRGSRRRQRRLRPLAVTLDRVRRLDRRRVVAPQAQQGVVVELVLGVGAELRQVGPSALSNTSPSSRARQRSRRTCTVVVCALSCAIRLRCFLPQESGSAMNPQALPPAADEPEGRAAPFSGLGRMRADAILQARLGEADDEVIFLRRAIRDLDAGQRPRLRRGPFEVQRLAEPLPLIAAADHVLVQVR